MRQCVFVISMGLAVICTTWGYALAAPSSTPSLTQLQRQTHELEQQLHALQQRIESTSLAAKKKPQAKQHVTHRTHHVVKKKHALQKTATLPVHPSQVSVLAVDAHPESVEFYPTALLADEQVITFIAGTPVVSTPYLGSRPAFDGSDYIVNIPSINRDIRLMQQRRALYRAYSQQHYPQPNVPILALSGKVEPVASLGQLYLNHHTNGDVTLGSSEIDVAAVLNQSVEGYVGIAYNDLPALAGGQRTANSALFLNMAFVNIGDLDKTPFYLTAGQLYAPFGRFATAMVSAPLTMRLARTRTRPFIFGYKSRNASGPFAALYAFKSDTTEGDSTVGGLNAGYVFNTTTLNGEIGASVISAINNAGGMQYTGSVPGTTFGGFASRTNGSEFVGKVPAIDVHGNIRFDRYNLTAEWVEVTESFNVADLSFNGQGAKPSAGQLEAAMTFMAFDKPSSIAVGYQWSREALALNIPKQRVSVVFNTSLWRNTVESLEYHHDIDYPTTTYANGVAPVGVTNMNTVGTGKSADTLLAQIGVYF